MLSPHCCACQAQTPQSILTNLARHASFGHHKRNQAFLRQTHLVLTSPPMALARQARHTSSPHAAMNSLYRFTSNSRLSLADLRRTRRQAVAEQFEPGRSVTVVHDPSVLNFTMHLAMKDRTPVGDHRQKGFELITCLALDTATQTPLGVVHDTLVGSSGPDDRHQIDYDFEPLCADFSAAEKKRLERNHRHQMVAHVRLLNQELAPQPLIHVADCEFDDVFVIREAVSASHSHCVLRAVPQRNLLVRRCSWITSSVLTKKTGPRMRGQDARGSWAAVDQRRLIEAMPLIPYKRLPLDKQGRVIEMVEGVALKPARWAELGIASVRARLYRPAKRNKRYVTPPDVVEINMVVIRELEEPPESSKRLEWVLWTDLPVGTLEEMALVGWIYESRWTIEPYHRLIKSGYDLEKLHFGSAASLARALVLISIGAQLVMSIRSRFNLPNKGPLPAEQYARVKQVVKQLEEDPGKLDGESLVLGLIVKLGGWVGRKADVLSSEVMMQGAMRLRELLESPYAQLLERVRGHPREIAWLKCV